MGMYKRDDFLEIHKKKLALRIRNTINVILGDLRIELLNALGPDLMKEATLQSQQGELKPFPAVTTMLEKFGVKITEATQQALVEATKEEKKKK